MAMNIGIKIGSNVNDMRRARGESLSDVAAATGIAKSQIWALEAGRVPNPGVQIVDKLAKHFRVKVSVLIDGPSLTDSLLFGRAFPNLTQRDRENLIDIAERMDGTPPASPVQAAEPATPLTDFTAAAAAILAHQQVNRPA